MNQQEQRQAETISNAVQIASEATHIAAGAQENASKQAERNTWKLMTLAVLGIIFLVLYGNYKEDQRNKVNAEQDRLLMMQKLFDMSQFYHTSLGERFTFEFGKKAFEHNGLELPPPDERRPAPKNPPGSPGEYGVYVQIMKDMPDIAGRMDLMVEEFNRRNKERIRREASEGVEGERP